MKVIRFLDKWLEEIIISAMMGYFVFSIVYEVFARLVGISAPWTEETARYTFIWMTLVGCAAAVKHGNHVRVDILEMIVPKKVKPYIYWISFGLFLAFCGVLCYAGIDICKGLLARPQKTAVLQMSTVWVYGALPVGMFLTCFRIVQKIILAIKAKGKGEGAQK